MNPDLVERSREASLMAVTRVEAIVRGDDATARATMPTTFEEATSQASILSTVLADITRAFGTVGTDHLQRVREHLIAIPAALVDDGEGQ